MVCQLGNDFQQGSPDVIRGFLDACWFAFKWGLLAALVAAVAVGLVYYSRLNDEIRRQVQSKLAAAYPH